MTTTILCAGALARPHSAARGSGPETGAPTAAPIADGALARTIRRARVAARARQSALVPDALPDEAWLRERFALDGTVAACALPASRGPGPDVLVRPVHLQLAMDHLVLAPLHGLDLARDEAETLAARANAMLADEGLRLRVVEPDAWRLEASDAGEGAADLAGVARLLARSARMAAGRNIDAYLPSGDAARRWRQLANLVQMAWFEHPINATREAEGRLPVNGLWLEGCAGDAGARPFARVVTTDPAIAGLAQRAGIEARLVGTRERSGGFAADWDAAVNAPDERGTVLLAPDFWRQAVSDGELRDWEQAWQHFDRWFEALLAAAPRIAARDLRLVLTGERSTIELARSPGDRWKAWRRLGLAALLREHA